jgi:6-phosphofructokinase 1
MRIGISTGGGDCPGLNAVIRAVVRTCARAGVEVCGIRDGLTALIREEPLPVIPEEAVREILSRGGTILGTTNRGNPFRYPAEVDGVMVEQDISMRLVEHARHQGLDGVIFVGGDGTQEIAARFDAMGLRAIGVPKTIDNDLLATDQTFGFDTAVGIVMEALDRLRTTAESHERLMALEVMGRHAGWIALHAGLAGDADAILLPEIPWDPAVVHAHMQRQRAAGIHHHIVVVAEGARPLDGDLAFLETRRIGAADRLGGAAEVFVRRLADFGDYESRVTVLGHIQRGGTPSQVDRLLATRFGVRAAELALAGAWGRLVVLRGQDVRDVPLVDATGGQRLVPLDHPLVGVARSVGVCMGDRLD